MQETVYTIPGIPPLALLTDFHSGDPTAVLASLRTRQPKLICLAGDLILGGRPKEELSPLTSSPTALPLLRACAAIAPTFLSLGNHDLYLDQEDLDLIASTGTTVLHNSWTCLTLEGHTLCLGGLTSATVTSYWQHRASLHGVGRYPPRQDHSGLWGHLMPNSHKPLTDWLSRFTAAPGVHVLLCHHPEYYPLLPFSLDLILSGHAHGGQWRYFSLKTGKMEGFYAPGQGFFPRWTRGIYDGRMVVSAGLTNTSWIPRFFNPPEIVYTRPDKEEAK